MSPEQVVVAVSKYEAELQAKGLSPVRQNSALFPTPHSGLQHALWVCGEVKAQISRNEIEKAMRWLGFIQAYPLDGRARDDRQHQSSEEHLLAFRMLSQR